MALSLRLAKGKKRMGVQVRSSCIMKMLSKTRKKVLDALGAINRVLVG